MGKRKGSKAARRAAGAGHSSASAKQAHAEPPSTPAPPIESVKAPCLSYNQIVAAGVDGLPAQLACSREGVAGLSNLVSLPSASLVSQKTLHVCSTGKYMFLQ